MPTQRSSAAPAAALGVSMFLAVASCTGPLLGPHAMTKTRRRPHKTTPQDVARVMVEKETYLVAAPKKGELLVRRCVDEGERDHCEVAWLVDGRIQDTHAATTVRANVPTALVHEHAEPITARIKKMRGHVLNVRERDVEQGVLYGPEKGSVYRFERAGDRLRIVYEPGSDTGWGTQVADVRTGSASGPLTSYITHDAYGLFAFQLRHETGHATSTSWVIFERQDPGPGGRISTIESLTGEHATVVSSTPQRVRLAPRGPSPSTEPQQHPLPTPPDSPIDPRPPRPCTDATDCDEGESCASPQARLWNHCGRKVQPNCPDGFISDGCGNCFAPCTHDAQCTAGEHCNGAWCESQAVCGVDDPKPQ